MKLAKALLPNGDRHVVVVEEAEVRVLDLSQVENIRRLSDILHSPDPAGLAKFLIDPKVAPIDLNEVEFLSPADQQEVWAAGVTYKKSQVARMEESEHAADHYDLVYDADRPELFFKSTAARVVANGELIRARKDSSWSVPEPELALIVSPQMGIVGYTVGNDVSARDIEGENPLYLPQAKVYDQSCALGPYVKLADEPLPVDSTEIKLRIHRSGELVVEDQTSLSEMKRSLEELPGWLGREMSFPDGAILMTGTGIIPDDDFTLATGDLVEIEITGIGTLSNPVIIG